MNNIKIVNNFGKDVKVEVNNGEIIITWIKSDKKLSDLKAGDIFKDSNGTDYIVCEQFKNGITTVIRRYLLDEKMKFGDTNDWRKSDIREFLNGEYLKELEEQFGKDNIVEFERDLISLDGYDDYDKCRDKVSIMSVIDYMKYHKYIGNCENWYWLLTPDSTSSGYGDGGVRYADSNGRVVCGSFGYDRSVRPFFILKSDIFVFKGSEEADERLIQN